jgi:multiple sugar transport system permease protein
VSRKIFIGRLLVGVIVVRKAVDSTPASDSDREIGHRPFTDTNLVAAASILAALPTLVVFLVLRRQLRRGLALGALR